MKEINLCDYGCGREAKFYLKYVKKWCCSKSANSCIVNKEAKRYLEYENLNNDLCDYGCGQIANFISKKGKKCCSSSYRLCPVNRIKIGILSKEYSHCITKDIIKKILNTRGKFTIYENLNNDLCDYGCGQIANFILSNGKHCCKNSYLSCSKHKELIGNKVRYNLEKYKQKFPKLFEHEELREIDGKIEGKCRHCGKWFILKYEQIRSRIGYIENKTTNCYFFCSKKCKLLSPDFLKVKKREEIDVKNYDSYNREVWRLTYITVKKYGDMIKDLNLRGVQFKKSLDHKYSIVNGYNYKIDPKIIANVNNLEIIDSIENGKKWGRSSITLLELFETYQD